MILAKSRMVWAVRLFDFNLGYNVLQFIIDSELSLIQSFNLKISEYKTGLSKYLKEGQSQ